MQEYLDEEVESCTRRAILYKVNVIYTCTEYSLFFLLVLPCASDNFFGLYLLLIMLFAGGCPVKEVIQEFVKEVIQEFC